MTEEDYTTLSKLRAIIPGLTKKQKEELLRFGEEMALSGHPAKNRRDGEKPSVHISQTSAPIGQ